MTQLFLAWPPRHDDGRTSQPPSLSQPGTANRPGSADATPDEVMSRRGETAQKFHQAMVDDDQPRQAAPVKLQSIKSIARSISQSNQSIVTDPI
jgi:hypothetical protein